MEGSEADGGDTANTAAATLDSCFRRNDQWGATRRRGFCEVAEARRWRRKISPAFHSGEGRNLISPLARRLFALRDSCFAAEIPAFAGMGLFLLAKGDGDNGGRGGQRRGSCNEKRALARPFLFVLLTGFLSC